jgi:hypothetical protein
MSIWRRFEIMLFEDWLEAGLQEIQFFCYPFSLRTRIDFTARDAAVLPAFVIL